MGLLGAGDLSLRFRSEGEGGFAEDPLGLHQIFTLPWFCILGAHTALSP